MLIPQNLNQDFKEQQKVAEIMFEGFGIQNLAFYNSIVLPLYSQGKQTGIVLDVGDS